jgi:hypothetical protein
MSEKIEKFTHGIMVIDPKNPNEDGSIPVRHFVGYWEEPQEEDVQSLYDELRTDEELGLTETIDELELAPATQEVLKHFNSLNYHDHEEDN